MAQCRPTIGEELSSSRRFLQMREANPTPLGLCGCDGAWNHKFVSSSFSSPSSSLSSPLTGSSSSSPSSSSTPTVTTSRHHHHNNHENHHRLTLSPLPCPLWRVSEESVSRRRSRPAAPWASWCPQSYVYLVLLVLSSTTTTTMSAPVPTPAPKWVNPCGIDPGQVIDSDEVTIPPLKHSMLYSNIALQAKLAKEQADSVSPVFVKESFKDENFPEYSRDLSYKWLPQIPVITDDLKANISPETALNDSYTYLQYYAVGIEQILQDQILYDGTFLEQFRLMEGKLRQVLCELQLAMIEMKIKQNADVQRDVMKQEFRDMDSKTARDLRDWIILRDYIGALDFISTIFEHLKEVAEKNQN